MAEKISSILITGLPGVGKTTIVKRLQSELTSSRVSTIDGFYTEEIRNPTGSERIGFDVITFDGKRTPLARTVETAQNPRSKPKVGKYTVEINSFENLALPILKKTDVNTLIIDEIGKMELFSKPFEQQIKQIISQIKTGQKCIIATIPCKHRIPIVEELRLLRNIRIFEITKQNRNHIYEDIKNASLQMLNCPQ